MAPWASTEAKTASAAMLAIRLPSSMPLLSTSRANVIVATPFGPNQPMNARVAMSVLVLTSARNTAAGRATSSTNATIATAARPSPNRASSVNSEPNTTNTPSLTTSISSSERSSKLARMSCRRMPNTMAQTNTAIRPLPCGTSTASPYARNAAPSA